MAEKFTPGEWRAEIEDHSFCDTGDYITTFGIVTGKNQFIAECFDTGKINEEEAAANCHLIAAAPKMYERLKGVRCFLWTCLQYMQYTDSLYKQIEYQVKMMDEVLKEARGTNE